MYMTTITNWYIHYNITHQNVYWSIELFESSLDFILTDRYLLRTVLLPRWEGSGSL